MRIVSTAVYPIKIPKKAPFQVTYATRTACLAILVRLVTDDGHEGWGEAVPVAEVTGENRAEVFRKLTSWLPANLTGRDPFDQEDLRLLLERELKPLPSARCAVDSALWDLRGRALGLSVRELLGAARSYHQASASIGIKSTPETVAEAAGLLRRGFTDIKVKIGLDPAADIQRIKALRQELGCGWRLYLDANQGYTPEEAIRLTQALADADVSVEFLEQPVAAANLEGLAEVTRHSPILIAADEAVKDPADLLEIVRRQAAHMVNIKLMKCGGPTQAAFLVRMAEAAGMKAMIGCMIESRVGITAGLSVALGLANVDYIDLDGYFDLADDIVTPSTGAQLEAGRQYLAPGAGLGLKVDEEKLKQYLDSELGASA
ncbi:MAG: dipeptide epimerase [Limnochordales bacterium]|nr:dipeptide epimerase [Limnochordales bacterium]